MQIILEIQIHHFQIHPALKSYIAFGTLVNQSHYLALKYKIRIKDFLDVTPPLSSHTCTLSRLRFSLILKHMLLRNAR